MQDTVRSPEPHFILRGPQMMEAMMKVWMLMLNIEFGKEKSESLAGMFWSGNHNKRKPNIAQDCRTRRSRIKSLDW
jgi:hypothetical protein